jgi:hypothetical protein
MLLIRPGWAPVVWGAFCSLNTLRQLVNFAVVKYKFILLFLQKLLSCKIQKFLILSWHLRSKKREDPVHYYIMRRSSFCTRIYQSQRFSNSRDLIRQRGGWWPTLEVKCQHRRYNVIQESRTEEFLHCKGLHQEMTVKTNSPKNYFCILQLWYERASKNIREF